MARPDYLSATARKEVSREATKAAVSRELMLVSILSRLWPGSHVCAPLKPQARLRYLVCLHSPAGSLLWRFDDDERDLFEHLPHSDNHAADYKAGDKEALLLLLATD